MANSFNLPNFSEIQQETSTAFLDKAAGNKLSSVQQEFINDSSYMPSERFDSKWGEGSYAQALNQMAQSSRLARDKSIGRKTSLFSADTLRNIISGATTGIASSGAYVAEKVGNKELAESLSDSTNDITDLFEKYASFEQKAADRAFSLENAIKKAESQRQYERDIFNGVPQEEALRAREVRDYHNSVVSSFETGQYAKALSQGTGSILSSVLLTRGVGGLVSNVGKAASVSASTAFKAKDAFHLASPRVQKALDTLSWMAVSGAQEAGGVLTEHLNEVTNLPDEAFSNSDQFNFRKAEYIKAGMSEEEASFQAKKDVAHLIANEAADKQFAITTPLNVLTSGLAKPFTMGGKRLSTFIGEALSEPVEEGIAEGSGKYFGNVAKQKYLDPSQDIYEGIGSVVAEGVVGGLGIGATRVPGTAIGTVADAITAGHNYYQNKQAEALPETLKEGSSEPIETETDSQVGNVTTQITSDTNSTFLYSDKGLLQEQSDKEATSNTTWDKAYFIDESSPISQDLTSEEGSKSLESFAEKTIDEDGTIQVKESKDSEWRPLKRSDLNKSVVSGSSEDTVVSLPKNSSPQQGNSILKVSLGENGNIQSISSAGKVNSISPIQVGNQEELVKSIAPKVQEKVGSIFTDSLESAPFTASSYEKSPIPGTQLIHGSDEGIYLSDGKGYVTIASPEESSYIDSLSDEDYVKELVSRIKQKAVGQLFTLQISDKETTINVLGNSYQFNGKTYDLSPETQQVFANPNATLQEKAKALESEFTGSNFTVTPEGVTSRDAYDLNPEEAEKLGKYIEDGEVKDYDREEVKQSWVNKFKEKFHKLVDYFIPVRRPTHLWNSDKSPIEVVQEVLQSKESLEKFLKANNFTNATHLANSLWNDKEKLIKEVVSMLSKDGIFMKKFQAQIDAGFFKMPENCPESIKEAFYDKDGNPNEKLLEIASIAALHWTAILSAYKHQLNEEELERLRIDPDLLESKFDTTGGVVTSVALQNLATSIRKFTGVAINNKVPQNEAERVFGYIATKTAGALIKSNVIETFEVTYTARERNKETGKFEVVEKKLQMMKPTKDFDKLFRPKSGILLSIIDPTYSNSFHLEPPPVKETVAHSSERITKTQRRVLEIANSKPAKINKLFVQFLAAIGGEEGLAEILEENAKEAYRHTKSFKDYQSKQGREISRRLAFDLIREILSSDTEMSVEEFKVYFSNIILKNSRVMQEGAATYQSNKLVRQILNYTDGKKHDLTDKKNFESWKLILAQNLGVKVNAILFKNYEEKIDAALKWMQERVYEPEYANLLRDIKNIDARTILNDKSGSNEIRQSFKNLLDAFNKAHKDLGLSLKKEEGFNALLEMLRYAEATKKSEEKSEDLSAFESHIFLEIDGINDGPSFINRLFGVGMGSFSSQFFTNNAKTGIYFGVMLTSQEAMNNPDVAKFLFGEEQGKDFHAEVAKEKITGYFLQRFLDFKKATEDVDTDGTPSNKAIEAERALKAIKNTLVFFKSIGWIDTKGKSVDEIVATLRKIPSNPEDYPFTFDREISKKLVTIIPYGSQPKGSTEQILQLGLETFYENMSKCFSSVISDAKHLGSYKLVEKFQTAMKYDEIVVIDAETTTGDKGPDSSKDVALQISVTKYKNGEIIEGPKTFFLEDSVLTSSGRLLKEKFSESVENPLYKVYNDKNTKKQSSSEVIKELQNFIGSSVLMGHNLENFDLPLLERQFGVKFDNEVFDTLKLSRTIQGHLKSHKLSDLIDNVENAHLADADVAATFKLAQELDSLSKDFLQNLTDFFEANRVKNITMNGVSFTDAMDALKNLFSLEYSNNKFTEYTGDLKDLVFSFNNQLPSKEELGDSNWTMFSGSGLLRHFKDKDAETVRNFYVKALGLDHLANLLVPIFGEPAQAAVNEVLTAKGMTGALYPTVISGLLTFVKTAVQNLYNSEKPLNSLSKNERFKIEKEMQAVGPNYQFSGGAKVVVEKTSYANENEVLYTDPETGLEYRSSQSFVTSSGVSGGPLTTQAAGDATTMMELEELLNNLGILVGSVHDGFYVGMGNENTVGNAANKASDLAQRQRILKSIRKQVDKAGKFITKKKWSTKDDPIEAIKDVLVKIAQGKLLNGKNAGEDVKQISKNMQYELLRYLDQVKESFAFESSFFKQRDARLHAPKKPIKEDAENVESEVRSALDTFFSKFDAVLLTEEINQQVLDDMPRTIQHMSGAHDQSATYSVGKVLEFAEALKVLNKVNEEMKKLNLPTFKTWGDLWSAFANLRAKILYDAKATELSKAKREAFEQLNGLDKGNSGTRNELPEEVYSLMTAHFGKTNEEPVKNKSDFSSRNLDKSAVAHAFNTISKKVKHPGIYNKFKDVIVKLLPDNLPITIVSSKAALPKEVRARFSNSKQLGVYIVSNGKPQIFIVSENGKLDTSDLGVAQTLVHEAVHAVISATIALYKQDPKRVPPAQRNALKNLEKLLDSFMKEVPSIQSDVIQELRNILENSSSMAEKLDESIAYVMSNVEIFNTLANHKFSDLDKHKANFKRLIKNIAKTIWSFISNLFDITENSALDNYFQKFFKDLDSTIPEELNFISLYGANTLVVLGANLKNPKGTKTREADSAVQDLIRSALVLPSADRTIRDITFSLESLRDTPMEFVTKASDLFIKASGWYKAMTGTGTLKQLDTFTERRRKISNEKIIIENNKLSNYQGALANALRNLVPEDKLDQTVNTITMLQTQGFVPPMVAEAINEMFINTRKQLDAHFMVDKNTATEEDYKISEGIYKLLFKTDLINKADRPEVLNPQFQNAAIFYALAANVPAFAEAVGNLKINAPKLLSFKDMVNPFNLKEGFEKISIALMDNWKHLKFGETSSGEIVHLIDNGKGEPGYPTLTKVAQAIDSVFHTVDRSVATVLLAPWIFFKNKNAKNLSESWKEVLESPVATHGFLMNRFRDFANNHCNVFMSGLIKELYGRTPSNTGVEVFLKKIKGFFDKDRKINLEFLTNKLISEFKNTKVDSKFRQLLHRVIGRSEIVHLSLDEAQKVLTDRKELLSKINSLEGDIRDQYVESTKYMDKALQLAKYLAGTGEAGHNLLTNGDAIGMLFGEPEAKSFRTETTHKAIHKINRLITLYYLRETMSETDFTKFKEVYDKDSQAINNVIEQLKSAYTREQERSYENFPEDVNKLYIYNRVHGFLPKGGSARGHYAIVPKSEAHNYWKKGYDILGEYRDSVKGTPMVRVYTQWPHEREAQEGIFQTITETAVGWEVQRKTRGEATGTKIIEPSIVSNLQTNYFTKQVDNVIPIYTTSGSLLGFERAIPMSDRNKINENTDLFSAIAQWNVRQTREQEAKNINAEAVDMLYQDWENASEEQKRKQFVDIFNTKDPAIKAAVQRLPGDLVKDIKKKFGGEICWVRKDVVWSYIGYHRMSITDVWDNTTIFPNALENTIAKILDLIFFNGRGRFYAGNIETVLMGAVTWVRDTIIVRSGIVPVINALANVLVLHFSLGIPLTKLYQLYKENYNLTMKYNHLTKKKMDLIYQKNLITPVFSDPDHPNNVRRNEIQSEIDDIESIYKNSPIYRLIKEGEYSTISAVGTTYEEIDIGKQKISDWLESRTNKFGEGSTARTAVSEILMNKSSTGYQLAADFVNLGDWLAKTVAYRYLTEGDNPRGLRLNHDEARNIASILFVDFDQFVSRERDWMNRIGLTWFMTYKYRMVPAALLGVLLNPSRLILGTALSNWTGLGTPFNENLIAKFLSGELGYSVGYEMLWSGATMHPIPTILNTVR